MAYAKYKKKTTKRTMKSKKTKSGYKKCPNCGGDGVVKITK